MEHDDDVKNYFAQYGEDPKDFVKRSASPPANADAGAKGGASSEDRGFLSAPLFGNVPLTVGTTAAGYGVLKAQQYGQKKGTYPPDIHARGTELDKLIVAREQAREKAAALKKELSEATDWKKQLNKPVPTLAEVPRLEVRPAGGEAVVGYAPKFGATRQQTMEAPSMQSVQRDIIPKNIAAEETMQRKYGGFRTYRDPVTGVELALDDPAIWEQHRASTASPLSNLPSEQEFTSQQQIADADRRINEARAANQEFSRHLRDVNLGTARAQGAFEALIERLPPNLREAALRTYGYGLNTVYQPASRVLSSVNRYLGPVAAFYGPSAIQQGVRDITTEGRRLRGMAEMGGGVGSMLALAPAAAAAGMVAPEAAATAAGIGALASIPALAIGASDVGNYLFAPKKKAQ